MIRQNAEIVADMLCGNISGFLQKTMYGDVWAEVNPEVDDSAYLHPDGHIVIARKEMDGCQICYGTWPYNLSVSCSITHRAHC